MTKILMMLILVTLMICKKDILFIDNYRLSKRDDDTFIHLIKKVFKSNLSQCLNIKCQSKPLCTQNNCHYNCLKYSSMYGGGVLKGYYFITDVKTNTCIAIKHSVYMNTYGDIIDITPFEDNRKYNLFLPNDEINYKYLEFNNNQIQSLGFNI